MEDPMVKMIIDITLVERMRSFMDQFYPPLLEDMVKWVTADVENDKAELDSRGATPERIQSLDRQLAELRGDHPLPPSREDRLLEALREARFALESCRVWQGMKWGLPSPMKAQKALDIITEALAKEGEQP